MLSRIPDRLTKLLRTRVVLEHPEAPEDTRVLNLFRNRAELKKVLGDAQDEVHRLRDRIKLQEAATARVREQLEQLEQRLATPASGLQCLVHYQLRDLWAAGHGHVAALVRELAQQREDRERRQFLAELNRQLFERQQSARAACAQAEQAAAEARARLSAIQTQLDGAQRWWHYLKRRDLLQRQVALRAETETASAVLDDARRQLEQIDEQGGAKYPGLSLDARRMLNLTAMACAQVLALHLAPAGLLARSLDAMSRSEPRAEQQGEAARMLPMMQEIARAKAAMAQNAVARRTEVRRLADHLAANVKFRSTVDTLPSEESVQIALRSGLGRGEQMNWDLLGQDVWSLTDLFYGVED